MSEKAVAAILGGESVLGRRVATRLSMADIVSKGLPEKSLDEVKESLGLSDSEMASTLGLSTKTIGRFRTNSTRRRQAHLPAVTSDRLYRLARIYSLALDVLEGKKAASEWLRQPQVGLGNRVPLDLLTTEAGAREVEDLLGRIEYGVIS